MMSTASTAKVKTTSSFCIQSFNVCFFMMPSVLFTGGVKSEADVEKSDAVSAQRERRFRQPRLQRDWARSYTPAH